jgi:quercetin dioxygenase-like cupin family protein
MARLATATVLIDNESVRVTQWRFAAGEATGWHRHEYDYVVVPLTDGRLRLVDTDGERYTELKTGVPYFREVGVEHDVVNASDQEFAFVEIEMKRSSTATTTSPSLSTGASRGPT